MSSNERVNHLRKSEFNMTLEEFGRRIQMTKGAVSRMEKGDRVVSERTIKIICSEFNVNEHWIRTGEGEMFIESDESIIAELAMEYHLDDFDKAFITHYLQLNSADRKKFKDYIAVLATSLNKTNETAATVEENNNEAEIEAEIEEELDLFRQELRAEKKATRLSASREQDII